MSDYAPIYRATVYAPRQVDSTEATILSPASGAPHSDDFKVATASGVTGFQPYMDIPASRNSRIDPIKRTTDTGQLTIKLLDSRVTAGGTNLERWVTAFTGDDEGRNQLLGCKVYVEESTDGGSGWDSFFTGRIDDARLDGRLNFRIIVYGMADDLDIDIFGAHPNASADSVVPVPLVPNGLVEPYGDFRGIGYLQVTAEAPSLLNTGVLAVDKDTDIFKHYSYITAQWPGAYMDGYYLNLPGVLPIFYSDGRSFAAAEHNVIIWCRIDSGGGGRNGEQGELLWLGGSSLSGSSYKVAHKHRGHFRLTRVPYQVLDATDPNYMAAPPDGAVCSVYIFHRTFTTPENPIIINEVHPVQLWQDILDGYYSRQGTDENPLRTVGYDSSAFAALIADTSIPRSRWIIDKMMKANTFIEKHICQPYNLAYRWNADGEVVPIDMGLPTSIGGLPTIIDSDIIASKPPAWNQKRKTAITEWATKYYVDNRIPQDALVDSPDILPDVSAPRLKSIPSTITIADFGKVGIGGKPHKVDALGFRSSFRESKARTSRHEWMLNTLLGLAEEMRGPFGSGASMATIHCRRTTNPATAQPGDYHLVTVDELPDPDTNERGGTRLMLVLGRDEVGLGIDLHMLDTALGVVADVPVVGVIVKNTNDSEHSVDVPVTVNGESQSVRVEYAATETSVGTIPAAGSDLWTFGFIATENGTTSIQRLPSGERIWVRGRTEPGINDVREIPSAWVVSTGTDYVDLDAMTAPSSFAAADETSSTADLSWTNGEADERIEVLVKTGSGAPGSWLLENRVAILAAGTTEFVIRGLDASTTHYIAVRHLDDQNGVSAADGDDVITTGTPPTAPRPAGIDEAVISDREILD